MIPLLQVWAEEYMKTHAGVAVYIDGGGTATGVDALINGAVDICAASRPLMPSEVQKLAEKHGKVGLLFLVAKDALSVYTHPENPIKNLSLAQLKDIFTGKIKNWSIVGGPDRRIHIYIRSPNSGTFLYFQEHVLDGDQYTSEAQTMPTTWAIVENVAKDSFAIGYGGIGYSQQIFHLFINGIKPTEENVATDEYPITRYLYLYTLDVPRGQIKQFIDWVTSASGQQHVYKAGYYPIWPLKDSPLSSESTFK